MAPAPWPGLVTGCLCSRAECQCDWRSILSYSDVSLVRHGRLSAIGRNKLTFSVQWRRDGKRHEVGAHDPKRRESERRSKAKKLKQAQSRQISRTSRLRWDAAWKRGTDRTRRNSTLLMWTCRRSRMEPLPLRLDPLRECQQCTPRGRSDERSMAGNFVRVRYIQPSGFRPPSCEPWLAKRRQGSAPFHPQFCYACHSVPRAQAYAFCSICIAAPSMGIHSEDKSPQMAQQSEGTV